MKENVFKAVFAVIVGGLTAYFREIAMPLIVLIAVMIIDYASGMIKAWINADEIRKLLEENAKEIPERSDTLEDYRKEKFYHDLCCDCNNLIDILRFELWR